tara:strand:+ start:230 stop:865 length:636 start_codon:yes stop_codon:yes gene_type:complete
MEPQLSAPYFVTALDRHKLGIELIVSIMRPFLSVQGLQYQATKEVLPPQELRIIVRVKETKTEATLVFQDHNEERILTQIERMSSYAGKQLTTKQISLPLTKIRKELNTLLDYLNEEDFGPVASLPDTRSKGRRSTITDDDLLRVAVKYNELQGASGAVRVVAKSENLSENTISQYIRRARKAGFLEPTTAGKKNFNLTPKALRLFVDETR